MNKPTSAPTPRRLKASPKARKMWAHVEPGLFHVIHADERLRMRSKHDMIPDYIPVFVLPGSREDVERMVEAVARVTFGMPNTDWSKLDAASRDACFNAARGILAAIGIRSRKERK